MMSTLNPKTTLWRRDESLSLPLRFFKIARGLLSFIIIIPGPSSAALVKLYSFRVVATNPSTVSTYSAPSCRKLYCNHWDISNNTRPVIVMRVSLP